MNKRSKAVAVLAGALLSAVIVYNLAAVAEGSAGPEAGDPAPALSLPALDGEHKLDLSSFKGQVVLVDFWASWCPPCQDEIPDLVRLHRADAKRGFTVLGVSKDDAPGDVRDFLRRQPIPYPLAFAGPGAPPPGWGVPGLPTAYLIGRDGRVLRRWLGEKDPDELRQAVAQALAAPAPARAAGARL